METESWEPVPGFNGALFKLTRRKSISDCHCDGSCQTCKAKSVPAWALNLGPTGHSSQICTKSLCGGQECHRCDSEPILAKMETISDLIDMAKQFNAMAADRRRMHNALLGSKSLAPISKRVPEVNVSKLVEMHAQLYGQLCSLDPDSPHCRGR
jgi:hypothetical protein